MANKIGGGRGRKGGGVVQLPGTQRQAGTAGDGRPLTSIDNLTPEEKAEAAEKQRKEREEAEAIQLLSIVSRAKKQLLRVEAAKTALKTEQDAFSDIARAGKSAIKIDRKDLMDLITDSNASRKDVTDAELKRARWRRAMGLPVADSDQQLELDARLPEVTRDGMFYRSHGYTDGVTGAPHNQPEGCATAGHGNLYDQGYKDGQASLHAALQAGKAKPKAEAAKPNPLDDPASPESLKANAASEKRARESLEAMGKTGPKVGDTEVTTDENGNTIVRSVSEGDDGFEATPEELAAQKARGKTAEEIAAESGEPEAVG